MPNTALIEARTRAHLSQDGLAREIQRAGWQNGDPNGCNRAMVQRWESGRTRKPQGRYQALLQTVLGQPIENLGFDADLGYGMSRAQAAAEAGLDAPVLPVPAETGHGPLTGIWLSSYTYASSGREGAEFTSRHYVLILHDGGRAIIRSVPASSSQVSMDASVNGQVVTGTWTERTRAEGYYRGATYTGAFQMLEDEPGERYTGKWVGFGKNGEINTGPWSLARVAHSVSPEAVLQWDLPIQD
jgi:transcriptional regulator with XRE-family HTH domain